MAKVIGTASDILVAIRDWAKGKFVQKETGKGLSTNDYTTTEKNKLGGIASGAQVNVIETVKVNNTALTPSSKAVNIDLSSYALKSDIASVYRVKGSCTWTQLIAKTDAEVGDVWNVTDKQGHNYVCTVAKTASANSWDDLGGGVDLSSYYTKTESDGRFAPKSHSHAISDITNLQTTLNSKANTSSVLGKNGSDDFVVNGHVLGVQNGGSIVIGYEDADPTEISYNSATRGGIIIDNNVQAEHFYGDLTGTASSATTSTNLMIDGSAQTLSFMTATEMTNILNS